MNNEVEKTVLLNNQKNILPLTYLELTNTLFHLNIRPRIEDALIETVDKSNGEIILIPIIPIS